MRRTRSVCSESRASHRVVSAPDPVGTVPSMSILLPSTAENSLKLSGACASTPSPLLVNIWRSEEEYSDAIEAYGSTSLSRCQSPSGSHVQMPPEHKTPSFSKKSTSTATAVGPYDAESARAATANQRRAPSVYARQIEPGGSDRARCSRRIGSSSRIQTDR